MFDYALNITRFFIPLIVAIDQKCKTYIALFHLLILTQEQQPTNQKNACENIFFA